MDDKTQRVDCSNKGFYEVTPQPYGQVLIEQFDPWSRSLGEIKVLRWDIGALFDALAELKVDDERESDD